MADELNVGVVSKGASTLPFYGFLAVLCSILVISWPAIASYSLI
jgi:hypothetical protein